MRCHLVFGLLVALAGTCGVHAQQFAQMPSGNAAANSFDSGYFAGNDNQADLSSVPVVQYDSQAGGRFSDSVYPAHTGSGYSAGCQGGCNGNCNGGCQGNCNGGCQGNCNGGCSGSFNSNYNHGWSGGYHGNSARGPFGGGFLGTARANHANRPAFSDTICNDDCSNCWPKNYPEYLALFGGWSDAENFESKQYDPTYGVLTEISGARLGGNFAGGGALGWVVHPLARTELEFTYRQHGVEDFHIWDYDINAGLISRTTLPASGTIHAYATMWNCLIHTDQRRVGCASLYGGGGIGALYLDGGFSTATQNFAISDASFAYQFIAGVNYVLRESLDTYVEYRYLGADRFTVQDQTNSVPALSYSYDSNAIFFGVRFGR